MFTNLGLVAYAQAMLDYGSPYWYGTFGNIASEELYQQKRQQYKEQYEKWSKYSFETQYGLKVHDCIGLIKGYLMNPTLQENGYVKDPFTPSKYNALYDWSANMLEQKATEKGPIGTIPEIPGIIVWKSGHVGIYIGNGWVIEERGHTYGTVKTRLVDRPWVKWLKHPSIQYSATPAPEPTPAGGKCMVELDVLRKGNKGIPVKRWQALLNNANFRDQNGDKLDTDGSFGGKTDYATRAFQKANGLSVDGVVGTKSWTKMIEG